MSIPESFLARLNLILSPETVDQVVTSFNSSKDVSFRVNTLLSSKAEVITELKQIGIEFTQSNWMADVFHVDPVQRDRLLDSRVSEDGLIYLQNPSSMLPVLELDPHAGDNVLDLTAAPGSKTSFMAALMNNSGHIAAVESVRGRYFKLNANLDRLGVTNVKTFLKDGRKISRYRPDHFDRVLLDAPCSSEGRFRAADPETTRYWSERKIAEMKRKQIQLLQSAVRCARVGGRIIYSTCSFAPEENEEIVTRILKRCGSFIEAEPLAIECPNYAVPLKTWKGRTLNADYSRRVLPDSTMDGFYIARFVKTAPNPRRSQ
ncbi:MAG: RsmB/NOP family class I SAM-dependent RNA methyltransferase [Rhodothermales bacterium]|nr:RsmB/NOP family class I SAM-dependent RNA methyltransferase [Rhodothermales bacterium]